MANSIPPVSSDSPPPLDLDLDDAEDIGFGNFRVAADLGLDLSDSSRNSPEVWNPSLDLFEDKNKRNTSSSPLASLTIDDRLTHDVTNSTMLPSDSSNVDKTDLLANSQSHLSDSRTEEVLGCDSISHSSLDNPDSSEILKELDSIPFSSYCDIGLEARTSPEGADAECTSECQPIPDPALPVCTSDGLKNGDLDVCKEPEVTEHSECVKSYVIKSNSESIGASFEQLESLSYQVEVVDDDFTDFTDFSSQPLPAPAEQDSFATALQTSAVEDDFDDFDDFECAVPAPTLPTPTLTPQTPVESVEKRLAAIFLLPGKSEEVQYAEPALSVCLNTCLDDSSSVWGHLKDLDTSPALGLQWSSSSSSRRLLSALSVDSRNILVGQRWNPMLPRYAANLSGVPLEPVIATPESAPPTAPVGQFDRPPAEDVVPAAQFDWTGSGLTNPLDFSPSSLLDLDFLIKFDNVASSPIAASAVWTSESSVEKEAALRDQPIELTLSEKWSPPSVEELPPHVWPLQHLPSSADILLPAPVSDLPPTDNSSQPSATPERADLSSLTWDSAPVGSMMTISSHFDSLWAADEGSSRTEITGKLSSLTEPRSVDQAGLSPSARRVVESLPDLSFLSARNLLYTANENMTRFHATHARN